MKFTLAVAALIGATQAVRLTASADAQNDLLFAEYMAKHNKSYATLAEQENRKAIFLENHQKLVELSKTLTTSYVEDNFLSDFTAAEVNALMGVDAKQLHKTEEVAQLAATQFDGDALNANTADYSTTVNGMSVYIKVTPVNGDGNNDGEDVTPAPAPEPEPVPVPVQFPLAPCPDSDTHCNWVERGYTAGVRN